jgi:glutathione-specific gamma-glutamylcyclotransferase
VPLAQRCTPKTDQISYIIIMGSSPHCPQPHLAGSSSADAAVSSHDQLQATWVFGYGSLMWNPEFDFKQAVLARVHGFHRAFCVRSTLYRGTPEQPGVVLGLDFGGSVDGVAFEITPGHEAEAIDRLYAREMIQNIYQPRLLNTRLRNGQTVKALAFVANRKHEGYSHLSDDEIVNRLSCCKGNRGPNCDYAINTHTHLTQLGVRDQRLSRIVARIQNVSQSSAATT